MLITEVKQMLGQTGLQNTYLAFPEKGAPPLPYLVWYFPETDNFAADDKVYKRINALNIELYTANKDFATEQIVEDVLNTWGMVWESNETYLADEKMYEVLYEMEITIDG